MIAGRMTEFVELWKPVVSRDSYGSETMTYEDAGRIHAEVRWRSGGTVVQTSEFFPDYKIEVLIRDAHSVKEGWRVEYSDITYTVTAIEHNRVKGLKRLLCERVND